MKKWRSSYYFRLVLSYTILVLVLIGFIGGYLLSTADRLMTSELSKDAKHNLSNLTNSLEQNLLKQFESAFQNNALMTLSEKSEDALNSLLERPARSNLFQVVSYIDYLGLIKDMTDGIEGITAYIDKGNYVMDDYRYYEKSDNSPDRQFIESLREQPVRQWFSRNKPTSSGSNAVMTYVFALPYYTTGANANGFLYLDIKMSYLQDRVRDLLQGPDSKLYVYDPSGKLLLGGQQADAVELARAEQFYRESTTTSGDLSVRSDSDVVSVLNARDSINGWTYILIRPMDSFLLTANKMKLQVWTASLIALLLGLVVSFMMSRHFYVPLKKLLYSIRNLYAGPTPITAGSASFAAGHEYSVMDHMLRIIDNRLLQMEDEMRAKQIAELITGQRSVSALGNVLALPLECRYAAIYIATESEHALKAGKLMGRSDGYAAESVSLSATEFAILLFIYDDYLNLADAVDCVVQHIREAGADAVFGAGVGSIVDSVEAINLSYNEAKEAYKYTYIQGKEAVIYYEAIGPRMDTLMAHISYDHFQHKVRAGHAAEAERWIQGLEDSLRQEPLNVDTIEFISLRLGTVLSQVIIEQKLQDAFPVFGSFDQIRGRTMDETFALLARHAGDIARHIHDSRSDSHQEKINQMKHYIDEHLAEDLSLEELASRVGLSANYVSTLFGSVTGEAFTEYVNRARLEMAAGLLVNEPKLSVGEIAQQTGYRNSQYFCNKFKSKYGITPLQYRKAEAGQMRLAE